MNFLLTQNFSTMNTKRLIFGLLAVVMLATTAVSTITLDDQDNGVRKSAVKISPKR
ncbi:MAG: hypothetical protein KJO73_08415 [Croceitalea sp.]|nr:hypothetical protein [Croceitalea sp.]NNC34786.1 hypothetical protein [Croceitalea sp.]